MPGRYVTCGSSRARARSFRGGPARAMQPGPETVTDGGPLRQEDRVVRAVADGPVAGGGVRPPDSLEAGAEALDGGPRPLVAGVGLERHSEDPPDVEGVPEQEQLHLGVERRPLGRRRVPGAADLGDARWPPVVRRQDAWDAQHL